MAGKALSCSKCFHLVSFSVFTCSLLYDFLVVQTPPGSRDDVCRKSPLGRIKYMSYINVIFLQCGFFGLALLNDFVGSNEMQDNKKSFLQRIRDFLFATLSFPFGVGVMTLFWVGYYFDRESVYPADMDTWKPPIVNHINHTLPGILMLIELVLVKHKFPKGILKYIPNALLVISYYIMLSYFVIQKKIFIYPTSHTDGYFNYARNTVVQIVLLSLFAYIGDKLNNMISGTSKATTKSAKSSKKTNQKPKKSPKKESKTEKPVETPKKSEPKQKVTAPKPDKPTKDQQTTKKTAQESKKQQQTKKPEQQPAKKAAQAPVKQTKPVEAKKSPPTKAAAAQPTKKQPTKAGDNQVRQRKK